MIDAQFAEDYGPGGPYGEHFMFNKNIVTIREALNPEIASTEPARNAVGAPAAADISVTFAAEVDGSTINASTMIVTTGQTGPHDGIISYDEQMQTVTFNPPHDFSSGEEVTVCLTKQILTPGGVPFGKSYVWSFFVGTTAGEGVFSRSANLYPPGQKPLGIAAADIDGDGDVDLISINDPTVTPIVNTIGIWLNDGAGQFAFGGSYSVDEEPVFVTTADFDVDGDLDVVTANFTSEDLSFLMNNGDGTFAPQVVHELPTVPRSMAAADYNNDGYPDIAVATGALPIGLGKIIIKLNQKDGTFPEVLFDYQTKSFG